MARGKSITNYKRPTSREDISKLLPDVSKSIIENIAARKFDNGYTSPLIPANLLKRMSKVRESTFTFTSILI